MTDPLQNVLNYASRAEKQLSTNTNLLNSELTQREQETRRAEALFQLFQEKRFVEDVRNGRVCQPPIFYEEWNTNIGRINEYVEGADNSALPQMYESYNNTVNARISAHYDELRKILK
ncbi:hypothetical protein M9Y10_012952 [Tritrichomonas musculus]|uniref:Uncharacterized protein n=1 Tax=Tritrichomonas musculus TaxID=1915356 RepID=A0ABR2I5R5_9EUKA